GRRASRGRRMADRGIVGGDGHRLHRHRHPHLTPGTTKPPPPLFGGRGWCRVVHGHGRRGSVAVHFFDLDQFRYGSSISGLEILESQYQQRRKGSPVNTTIKTREFYNRRGITILSLVHTGTEWEVRTDDPTGPNMISFDTYE